MKRIFLAASAALLLAGASGAAIAQDRAPASVAAPAVWHGQGNTALDTTKVDWRDHRGRDWRRNDWRRHEWRRDNWRRDRWGWQRHDWRWRHNYRHRYDRRWW
jgi:hypothetical protein